LLVARESRPWPRPVAEPLHKRSRS
jgi:hypothetical protein